MANLGLVVHLILVELWSVTIQDFPSIITSGVPDSPVPVNVITYPPLTLPLLGLTLDITGVTISL